MEKKKKGCIGVGCRKSGDMFVQLGGGVSPPLEICKKHFTEIDNLAKEYGQPRPVVVARIGK